MRPTPTTFRTIFRVLVMGFAGVILLLLAAGIIAAKNARLIQESSAALIRSQLVATGLIEELQREQSALNATFYRLSRSPEAADEATVLSELDAADEGIARLSRQASGTPEEALWTQLRQATLAFSSEARNLLALKKAADSRPLLRRHETVVALTAQVFGAGYRQALRSQTQMNQRAGRLVNDSFLVLGGCLVLALVIAVITVSTAAKLFRRVEWQASELSRVTWHMLENQETTARRFSHELHDELGQALTALKANLGAMSAQPAQTQARLEDSNTLVDEAIRNVRELSQLLRPTILDDFGLDAGLRWQAERFTQRTGIEVEYSSTFHDRLPDGAETHLFRIVQEALTNVARHSAATRVKIELHPDATRLHLRLSDNGRGLPGASSTAAEPAGMGLIGMRARARTAGGELHIHSSEGAGVSIESWVPIG